MFKDEFKNLNKEQLLKLLAVIILSEGYVRIHKHPYFIRLQTIKDSKEQHKLFKYLCKTLFNKEPKQYEVKNCIELRLNGKKYINQLLKLSPIFKTTPGYLDTKENYLKNIQPTISFLKNESKKIKELALRLYFDFDGSVVPRFSIVKKKDYRKKKKYTYLISTFVYDIRISETNPFLLQELKDLANELGYNFVKKKDKRNWSGYDGIVLYKKEDLKRFLSVGPITRVKISGKSPRFKGQSKKAVCLAILDLINNKNIKNYVNFNNEEETKKYRKKMENILLIKIKEKERLI